MLQLAPSKRITASNIKHERSIDSTGRKFLRNNGFSSLFLPSSARFVEVLCLNKVYKGLGFRNKFGGLEFFNEDYRKQLSEQSSLDLEAYREREAGMRADIEAQEQEITEGNFILEQQNLRFQTLEGQLESTLDELEALKARHRQGEVCSKDAILRRNRLIAESRRLENDITALENDIDVTINKKKQLPYERLVLEELEAKIQEREVSMKAERTITIDQMGISLFPKFKEIPTLECCLFTSFLDYMAYKTICREDISLMGEEHIICDCIVLNNPSNFIELLLEAAPYDKVHCMFPSTVAGRVMCETMKSCNPHAVDHYEFYENDVTLYAFVSSFAEAGLWIYDENTTA